MPGSHGHATPATPTPKPRPRHPAACACQPNPDPSLLVGESETLLAGVPGYLRAVLDQYAAKCGSTQIGEPCPLDAADLSAMLGMPVQYVLGQGLRQTDTVPQETLDLVSLMGPMVAPLAEAALSAMKHVSEDTEEGVFRADCAAMAGGDRAAWRTGSSSRVPGRRPDSRRHPQCIQNMLGSSSSVYSVTAYTDDACSTPATAPLSSIILAFEAQVALPGPTPPLDMAASGAVQGDATCLALPRRRRLIRSCAVLRARGARRPASAAAARRAVPYRQRRRRRRTSSIPARPGRPQRYRHPARACAGGRRGFSFCIHQIWCIPGHGAPDSLVLRLFLVLPRRRLLLPCRRRLLSRAFQRVTVSSCETWRSPGADGQDAVHVDVEGDLDDGGALGERGMGSNSNVPSVLQAAATGLSPSSTLMRTSIDGPGRWRTGVRGRARWSCAAARRCARRPSPRPG